MPKERDQALFGLPAPICRAADMRVQNLFSLGVELEVGIQLGDMLCQRLIQLPADVGRHLGEERIGGWQGDRVEDLFLAR